MVAAPEASARADAQVLLDGLNSPKGVAVLGSDVIVSQGAFGPPDTGPVPGPVLQYVTRGRDRGTSFPVTEPVTLVDVAISPLDGTGWGLFAGGLLVHQLDDGSVVNVLDMVAYQETDPDPVDQDDFAEESNAYGLAIAPNGDALVADAAGNDIVRVTPEGVAWTVARFDLEEVATDLTPIPGLPPTMTAEAVPTSVAFGRDGDIYVGRAQGLPVPARLVERLAHRRRRRRRLVHGQRPQRLHHPRRRPDGDPGHRFQQQRHPHVRATSWPPTASSPSRPASRRVSSRRPCCSRCARAARPSWPPASCRSRAASPSHAQRQRLRDRRRLRQRVACSLIR